MPVTTAVIEVQISDKPFQTIAKWDVTLRRDQTKGDVPIYTGSMHRVGNSGKKMEVPSLYWRHILETMSTPDVDYLELIKKNPVYLRYIWPAKTNKETASERSAAITG